VNKICLTKKIDNVSHQTKVKMPLTKVSFMLATLS